MEVKRWQIGTACCCGRIAKLIPFLPVPNSLPSRESDLEILQREQTRHRPFALLLSNWIIQSCCRGA